MRVGIRTGKRFGIAQGTGHRAQGTGRRAQGAGHRAQGTGHRGKNGMRLAAKDEETARPQDRKTARLQDRKTARLQDKVICMRCVNIYLLIRINNIYITFVSGLKLHSILRSLIIIKTEAYENIRIN